LGPLAGASEIDNRSSVFFIDTKLNGAVALASLFVQKEARAGRRTSRIDPTLVGADLDQLGRVTVVRVLLLKDVEVGAAHELSLICSVHWK
jgi:hypothetical protein